MKMVVRGAAWGRMRRLMASAAGFTIVETMIVLAVTGGLFVAIAATLAGRQNAVEFSHAIQAIQANIQQVINQVPAGFYPNANNFICTNNGGVNIVSGSSGQGTNADCVFLGKVVQFAVKGTDPEQYQVYTIAGLRGATPPPGATSPFATSDPTVVGVVGGNYADYSDAGYLEYGLTTHSMTTGSTNIGAVAFLMEPGSSDSSSPNGYSVGSQQVDLIPIPAVGLQQPISQAVGFIQSNKGGLRDPKLSSVAPINPRDGVQICFVSGSTNQSGLITIGGSGRQLLVKLDVRSNQTCSP
jgi:type II secretory pathway pseudopilin PulG